MKKIAVTLLCLGIPFLPTWAIVEFGGGAGYTSFNFTDRGEAKYTLKNSTYSGPIYHGSALFNFALHGRLTLGIGGVFEASTARLGHLGGSTQLR